METETFSVIEGEHRENFVGDEFREMKWKNRKSLPIRIHKGLIQTIQSPKMIEAIIHKPGTKTDKEEKEKERKFFFPKELSIVIEPDKEKA